MTAIVAPPSIADIRTGLDRIDVPGVTISEVTGTGVAPRVRVEVMTDDESVDDVVAALAAARTGKTGDGKVWVVAIEQIVRIRTGERGADAL